MYAAHKFRWPVIYCVKESALDDEKKLTQKNMDIIAEWQKQDYSKLELAQKVCKEFLLEPGVIHDKVWREVDKVLYSNR